MFDELFILPAFITKHACRRGPAELFLYNTGARARSRN